MGKSLTQKQREVSRKNPQQKRVKNEFIDNHLSEDEGIEYDAMREMYGDDADYFFHAGIDK